MPLNGPVTIAAACVAWLAGPHATPSYLQGPSPTVHANDNRRPAGRLKDGVLHLDLEVRMGRWHPEAENGPWLEAPVFAERGRPPQVPGPLIRVPTGTTLEVTVFNALRDSTLRVFGLVTRPAEAGDSLLVPPGERRTVRFAAGAPGTYLYWAEAGGPDTLGEHEQLAGAFVVDSGVPRPDDRVFVINIWSGFVDSAHHRNALAINGKSWPYTERIGVTLGDSVRWRWVNASGRPHPMHLHGSYFRVDASGHALADTVYALERRRLVVTETVDSRHTMDMVWSPSRPGNWLFHCHIAFHVIPEAARFDTATAEHHAEHDHMAGLVLGINVRPSRDWHEAARPDVRRLRFTITELPPHRDSLRSIGVSIADPGTPEHFTSPGPVLVTRRNQPTDVTVVNRLAQSTAIHWHGLELESWSDGVAGWSGMGASLAPPIAPGDSFVAHLSLPRAGTFIYHTHLHDLSQITAGLYGAIVVLDGDAPFDPSRDHVFVLGWDGSRTVVNGDSTAPPLELAAGVAHRLRFVNILPAGQLPFALYRDSTLASWRALARDGADLPPAQAVVGAAQVALDIGMTYDAEFTPEAGTYVLRVAVPGYPVFYEQRIVVR